MGASGMAQRSTQSGMRGPMMGQGPQGRGSGMSGAPMGQRVEQAGGAMTAGTMGGGPSATRQGHGTHGRRRTSTGSGVEGNGPVKPEWVAR